MLILLVITILIIIYMFYSKRQYGKKQNIDNFQPTPPNLTNEMASYQWQEKKLIKKKNDADEIKMKNLYKQNKTKVILFEFINFEGRNWIFEEGEYDGDTLICNDIPLKSIGSCIIMPKTKLCLFRHKDLTGIMHDRDNLDLSIINPYQDKIRKIDDFIALGWNNQTQSVKIEKIN